MTGWEFASRVKHGDGNVYIGAAILGVAYLAGLIGVLAIVWDLLTRLHGF
jgi:hypothetical protein